MPTDMHIVQYADLTGAGFSRHEVPGERVDHKFWRAAQALVQREVGQPPSTLRTTVKHPVWGLRRVQVEGEYWWCFSVQGRGGDRFGVAGTCRFGFSPDGARPVDVWRVGVDRVVAGDPQVPEVKADPNPDMKDALAKVFAGLALDLPAVLIPGSPTDAATIIEHVLDLLPVAVVRTRTWSTCLLQRHDLQRAGLVAARWPPDFEQADTRLSTQINQGLPSKPSKSDDVAQQRGEEKALAVWLLAAGGNGLRQLAAEEDQPSVPRNAAVDRGGGPRQLGSATVMDAWLNRVYRKCGGITEANVGAQVMVPAQHDRLLRQHFDYIERWARTRPAEALQAVKDLADGKMRDVLFDLLVGGLHRTKTNTIGLPTAMQPVPSRWCIDLANLLRRYVERKGLSVETFASDLRGSVLKSGADFYAARMLWSRLGYEPRDDDYVVRSIVDEIARTDRMSAEAHDALMGMRQPIQQLVDVARERPGVAPGIPPVSPETAADLLLVSVGADRYSRDRDGKVGFLARVLADMSLPDHQGAKGPEDWVTCFLGGVEAPRLAKPTRRAVADGAWTALKAHLPGIVPGPALELVLKEFGLPVTADAKEEKAPGRHDTVDVSHVSGSLTDPARKARTGRPWRWREVAHAGVAPPGGAPPPGGYRRRSTSIAGASDNAKRIMLFLAGMAVAVALTLFVGYRIVSTDDNPLAASSSGASPSTEAQGSSAAGPTATTAIPANATFVIAVGDLKDPDADIRELFERKADNLATGRRIVAVVLTPIGNEGLNKLANVKLTVSNGAKNHRFKVPSLQSLGSDSVVQGNRDDTFPGAVPGVGVTLIFA
jgi:hypothetical protein